jgi:ParB-like nuclease domain
MARKAAPEKSWPIAKVEWRETGTLKQSPGNPKDHPAGQVDEILTSIKQFGWTMPILVDENDEILAGHGRDLAAIKGKLPKVPVIVAQGWSEADKIAYRLGDNFWPTQAPWRPEFVNADLNKLEELNFNTAAFGLDAMLELPELEGLIPAPPKAQRSKQTIFLSILNQDVERARKVITAALDKAKISHNL